MKRFALPDSSFSIYKNHELSWFHSLTSRGKIARARFTDTYTWSYIPKTVLLHVYVFWGVFFFVKIRESELKRMHALNEECFHWKRSFHSYDSIDADSYLHKPTWVSQHACKPNTSTGAFWAAWYQSPPFW